MKRPLVALAAVLLAGVTACGSQPQAQPQPAPATPTTTNSTTTTTSDASSKYAEQRDPCALLSSADKAQLALSDEKRSDTGSGQTCLYDLSWKGSVATVGVTTKAGQPLSQLSSQYGKTVDIQLDGQSAKRIRSATGGCIIAIASSETSRVEISGYAGSQDAACKLAKKVAGMVQENLTASGSPDG